MLLCVLAVLISISCVLDVLAVIVHIIIMCSLHSNLFQWFTFCRYYVGAVDRETKRMTVHRAELMHLRPYIPGTLGFRYTLTV